MDNPGFLPTVLMNLAALLLGASFVKPIAPRLNFMPEKIIEARGLRVAYGDHVAVQGIDLEVRRGELVGLLGTNGAGKTTLLECLEGLRAPDAGQIRVFGKDPSIRRQARSRTGIMLQEGGFVGDLTVRETVEMWRSLTSDALPVEEALATLFLSDRAGVRVKQLSGGERRRLDVVLATMTGPDLLFLDEPTTGLDAQSRQATWDVIDELQRCGTTIVLTTHYLEEAERLADRLVILHEGRIEVEGSLTEIAHGMEANITFRLPDSATFPADLLERCMQYGSDPRAGGLVRISTQDLQAELLRLLRWAEAEEVQLESFRAGNPTLDEVFASVIRGGSRGEKGERK